MISGTRIRLQDEDQLHHYGRWTEDRNGAWVLPGYVTYSDYTGSLVERANLEAFVEQFADFADVEWAEVTGGYGTRGLIVRFDADERVPEIGEFFDALEQYPLADEERHTELEMDAQQLAWEEYGLDDFIRDIEEANLFPNDRQKLEGGWHTLEDDAEREEVRSALTQMYWALSALYGAYPEVENAAGSVAFHTSTIIKALQCLVEDLNVAGEQTDPDAFFAGQYGPGVFYGLVESALFTEKPDPRQFEYGAGLRKLLSGHVAICHSVGKREVFRDILREQGLEAGLKFLEGQAR